MDKLTQIAEIVRSYYEKGSKLEEHCKSILELFPNNNVESASQCKFELHNILLPTPDLMQLDEAIIDNSYLTEDAILAAVNFIFYFTNNMQAKVLYYTLEPFGISGQKTSIKVFYRIGTRWP